MALISGRQFLTPVGCLNAALPRSLANMLVERLMGLRGRRWDSVVGAALE